MRGGVPLFLTTLPIIGNGNAIYRPGEPGKPGLYFRTDLPPGTGHWNDTSTFPHLEYTCPCGCGVVGILPCIPPGVRTAIKGWEWDGERESPTLSPSIKKNFGCGWHGWLKDGRWTTA